MKFESWVIFKIAKDKLPIGAVQRIFTRSSRLVNYWAANPRTCEVTKRNPVDQIRLLLEQIDLAGYGDYARAAIDYMAEPLGIIGVDIDPAQTDKYSIDGEIADISIALGDLASQIRKAGADGRMDTAEKIRIKDAARTIKREVEQLLDAAGFDGQL